MTKQICIALFLMSTAEAQAFTCDELIDWIATARQSEKNYSEIKSCNPAAIQDENSIQVSSSNGFNSDSGSGGMYIPIETCNNCIFIELNH